MGEIMIDKTQCEIKNLFDLSHTLAAPYMEKCTYPWEMLDKIKSMILEIGATLDPSEYDKIDDDIWVAKDATVYPTAYIGGPCIIGHKTEVRHCAFIRGSALIGNGCVIGNSAEVKNSIIFDGVQTPHYNYVGDSILGYKSHMGAGSITSNVKSDKTNVVIRVGEDRIETVRKKVGAMLGDFVEVGCNSVLNPGTVIGRGASIYPLSSVRGTVPAGSIYKSKNEITERK